ncbi:MAG TPA: leucyl aminopeptidase [Solirubrobacteraceae bacterium]
MHVEASSNYSLATGADAVAVGVFEHEELANSPAGGELQALLDSGEGGRAFKRVALTHHQGRRMILVGLGPRTAFDGQRARAVAALAERRARQSRATSLCWVLPRDVDSEVVEGLVQGTMLGAYRFRRYRPAPAADPAELQSVILSAPDDIAAPVHRAAVLAAAQNRARDLGNTPANDLTPAALAEYASGLPERHPSISATILDGAEIRARGMGAFAAIAQGSDQDPRLITLEYDGAAAPSARLALIGKAVTFDTGGLWLKPGASQIDMKFDMCGGAAVIEAVAALAELRAPVRVLAVIGATENVTGARAVKPGDIVTALDGTTIEVNNTDAEGRLVLADCITHARRQGCDAIIDIATLTGAVTAVLGSTYAGMMSNDDPLAELVRECGRRTGEPVWRLPLDPEYAELVKGRYAQLTNRSERREAMAITAAELLHHFVGEVPWVHLDIAGTADHGHAPYHDKGATGFGVRLLSEVALGFAG